MIPRLHFWPALLQAFALVASPRLGLKHSPWVKLVVRAITLGPPFPNLGFGQSLELCPILLQLKHVPLGFPLASPLIWLPLKGTAFLMKFPLGLKPEP